MGLTAAMISQGSVSSKWTVERMQNYFDEVEDLDVKKLQVKLGKDHGIYYDGEPLKHYDCIFAKGSYKHAVVMRSLSSMMAGNCYMPFKASAFTVGHNKLLTQIKLQQAGIPTPTSYLSPSVESAKKVLEEISYPVIIKFPEGTQGKGVMFADSYASASSMLDAFASLKQPVIIQEYIETGSTDTRAIVVGDRVVAAMQRKAETGEKRANLHAGGVGEPVELDAHAKNIAVKTARAMDCGICAVDILEGVKGPYVIEINIAPGLQGITQTTNVDVAEKIAKYLYNETKKLVSEEKDNGTTNILKEMGIDNGSEKSSQEIITSADLRGSRLLLPDVVTKMGQIGADDEIVIKAEKGKIEIKKA